jgi:ATP-dependent Clp protease ATP-binding subunit ClpA
MPKINVYLPEGLAEAVRDAQLPVSAICQSALEAAVRDVTSARGTDQAPAEDHPGVGLFGRFTPRARQALALAERMAHDAPAGQVGTEHLLLGVIDEGGNVALRVLDTLDVEPADLRAELVGSMPPPGPPVDGRVQFGPLAKQVLALTATEARSLGHNYVGCEHLLLGLLGTEDGIASQVMRRIGLELRTTRRAVITTLSGYVHAQAKQASQPDKSDKPKKSDKMESTLEEILRRVEAIERRLDG